MKFWNMVELGMTKHIFPSDDLVPWCDYPITFGQAQKLSDAGNSPWDTGLYNLEERLAEVGEVPV